MRNILLLLALFMVAGCHMAQQPGASNGATIYTTPGSPGGVNYSHYEVTPL